MCARYREYPGIERDRLVSHTIENEEQLRAFRETWSGQRMLEVNVIASSYQKSIAVEDLSRFVDVLKTADIELNEREQQRLRLVDLLCKAQTNDLQCPDWKFPWFSTDWTFAVQNKGMEKYGDKFRFLGFDLQEFSHSPLESRERTANSKIAFAAPPFIGCDLILYSGTVHPEFAEYRLGQKIANPFASYVFKHHETKWYNLASRLGTRQCFKWNGVGVLNQPSLFDALEENPPLREALDFYKHAHNWSNRLIAGDSLLVMNSLLEKEGMAGKVQMVYIDPPYGIKYGSNFQPFVNKRDVKDGKDEDLTQEPEMIRAFRDTWELGIHSYLTYLRDRLLLAKDLLHESGSVFVQISNENIHFVRNLLDEVFKTENFCSLISRSE